MLGSSSACREGALLFSRPQRRREVWGEALGTKAAVRGVPMQDEEPRRAPLPVQSGYLNAGTAEAGIKDISTNRGVLQWSS